jgi:hypothetical protein
MATRRSINFAGAMHEMHSHRRRTSVSFIVADRYDCAAIMKEAAHQARMIGYGPTRLSWARRMAITLRSVWHSARQAMVTGRLARPIAA